VRWRARLLRGLGGLRGSPAFQHVVQVDKGDEDGRADRDAPPLKDPPVEVADDLTDVVLRAHVADGPVADRLGQSLDLPAQPQRGGQELLGGHSLAPCVVAQPCLAVVRVAIRLELKRLARPGQVVEHPALFGLSDLLVDPRGEAHPLRLALCHLFQNNAVIFSKITGAA
jgi:hypothetical protein